jgi:hypothetical protein
VIDLPISGIYLYAFCGLILSLNLNAAHDLRPMAVRQLTSTPMDGASAKVLPGKSR